MRFTSFVEEIEKSERAPFKVITPEESVEIIRSSATSSFKGTIDEAEAKRWGITLGNPVAVLPVDESGSPPSHLISRRLTLTTYADVPVPTIGELVALDFNETVLQIVGKAGVAVRVHFPRIDYALQGATTLDKA